MTRPASGPPSVVVWSVPLDRKAADLLCSWAVLSDDERQRAHRLLSPVPRLRFVAARGALRMLLGACLSVAPQDLIFGYGPGGKPYLSGAPADSRLRFSLSHSEDLMLLAVARGATVGVDVEALRPLGHLDAMARRHLAAGERAVLDALDDPDERTRCFLTAWTAKEAYLKAEGTGLGRPPAQIEVDLTQGLPPRFRRLPESARLGAVELHAWVPQQRFLAALVVEGGAGAHVRRRPWSWGAPPAGGGPVPLPAAEGGVRL